MSDLSLFLKSNKKPRENFKYAATKSLCDENGKPLEWTIKPLTTKESEEISEMCIKNMPVKGKSDVYRPQLDIREFSLRAAAASVVEPNLYSAELQDSYGVKTPEELLMALIDDPSEYAEFLGVINGHIEKEDIAQKREQAKN
ncbi:MAG: hypothetical protein IJR59_01985 [Firmicutes bacterium]|nr:hypothetical protein [Bacillota bacterium]